MKLKFFGEWFGFSFIPFVILAAIVGIPVGRMIGGLLLRAAAAPVQARSVLTMPPADSGSQPAVPIAPPVTASANAASNASTIPPAAAMAPVGPSPRTSAAGPATAAAAPSISAEAGKRTASSAAPKSAATGSAEQGALAPGGSLVQVAAVTTAKTALGLADALKKKGYPVFVTEPNRDVYYRVEVGPYPNRHDARMVAQALEADGFQVFVITVTG